MVRNPRERAASTTPAAVAREDLVATLGADHTSWFSDSNLNGFQLHLDWPCGCRARKSGQVDRLWSYEPCTAHRKVPALL